MRTLSREAARQGLGQKPALRSDRSLSHKVEQPERGRDGSGLTRKSESAALLLKESEPTRQVPALGVKLYKLYSTEPMRARGLPRVHQPSSWKVLKVPGRGLKKPLKR